MSANGVPKLLAQPLKRISPSRYVALRECALRELFAASGNQVLLPISPYARVGTIIHRLLQDVGTAAVAQQKSTLEEAWNSLVAEAEAQMSASAVERFLLPLRANVNDFEVRKIRAFNRALALQVYGKGLKGRGSKDTKPALGCEIWVQSFDGNVGGFIDAVYTANGIVICDYKSGLIFEGSPDHAAVPKDDYVAQLKLYCALYFESFGVWPSRAELLPLVGSALYITIEPEDCLRILANANELFNSVNSRVLKSSRMDGDALGCLASPGKEQCARCLFRPACPAYRAALLDDSFASLPDVVGSVNFVVLQGNQRYQIGVRTVRGDVVVRQLSPVQSRHQALNTLQTGDPVGIYDVQFDSTRTSATETNKTTIYRL